MLNKAIIASMPEEIRALYLSTRHKKIEDADLRRKLYRYIENVKYRIRYGAGLVEGSGNLTHEQVRLARTINSRAERFSDMPVGSFAKDFIACAIDRLYENKRPSKDFMGNWVTVELEYILPDNDVEQEFGKWVRNQGFQRSVTIKDDGSLEPDGEGREAQSCGDCDGCTNDDECHEPIGGDGCEYGKEIVVSFTDDTQGHKMLKAICKKLTKLGCYVNASCGTHLHFDMRHTTKMRVAIMAKRIALTVPALRLMLPKSRSNSTYCQADVNTFDEGQTSRYAFVNMHSYDKHETLEIRGHSGTLNASKILNWTRICKVLMETRRERTIIDNPADLVAAYVDAFGDNLCAYIMARARKFAPSTVEDETSVDHSDEITADMLAPTPRRVPMRTRRAVARAVQVQVLPRIEEVQARYIENHMPSAPILRDEISQSTWLQASMNDYLSRFREEQERALINYQARSRFTGHVHEVIVPIIDPVAEPMTAEEATLAMPTEHRYSVVPMSQMVQQRTRANELMQQHREMEERRRIEEEERREADIWDSIHFVNSVDDDAA